MRLIGSFVASVVDLIVTVVERSVILTFCIVGFFSYLVETGYHNGREIAVEWLSKYETDTGD